jgi:hypothetical protein
MSPKLKALCLGLAATLAIAATAAIPAPAETGGHFISEVTHTILEGEDLPGANYAFSDASAGFGFNCEEVKFAGTIVSETATEAVLTPTFVNCKSESKNVTIKTNGCTFLLTIRKKEPEKQDNTIHLVCPGASTFEITVEGPFGNCLITVKAQTPSGGMSYGTAGTPGVGHDLNVKTTIGNIHAVYHGGVLKCGVNDKKTLEDASMAGETTLRGYTTEDVLTGITATGG